jgi:hypothetical protein
MITVSTPVAGGGRIDVYEGTDVWASCKISGERPNASVEQCGQPVSISNGTQSITVRVVATDLDYAAFAGWDDCPRPEGNECMIDAQGDAEVTASPMARFVDSTAPRVTDLRAEPSATDEGRAPSAGGSTIPSRPSPAGSTARTCRARTR